MKYAKIIVKSDYEQRGDLVLRSYIRAIKKVNGKELLDNDKAFIYGIVDEQEKFHEFFTKNVIDYANYVLVPLSEYVDICFLPKEKKKLLKKVIEKVLFNQENDLDLEISTMEDLASDRKIESIAYDRFLSRVNPYQRLNDNTVTDCNDFLHKTEAIREMKLNDSFKLEPDAYEVFTYKQKPESEEGHDYLVFEKTKVKRK